MKFWLLQDKDMSESEDDISLLKRKNLMMVDCDSSPLEPKQMAAAENRAELDIEKLLLERVMLRKELRLRSVQERLVHTNNKLELVQDRLLEYESLPGFRQFLAMSQLAQFALRTGGSGAGLVRRSGQATYTFLCHLLLTVLSAPLSLFYLLPSSLQMLSASLVATLASWLGETAENVSNECRERTEDRGQRTDLGEGQLARRNKSRRRRRS